MSKDKELTFQEHLAELASRLKIILYTLVASTIIFMALPADLSFLHNPPVFKPLVSVLLNYIREDILPASVKLIAGEITTPLELYILASFALGVAVTLPVMFYEVYKFVDPALYPEERRMVYPFVAAFISLFIAGAVFGYKILSPFMIWALLPFFEALQVEALVYVMDFYTLVFTMVILCGLVFTFPVIFVILVKFNIVGTEILTKNRKYVYAALFVVTALITPDGGPIADIALFAPLVVLLEVGILVAKRYEKQRAEKEPPVITKVLPTDVSKCRYCGAEVKPNATFCPKCGKALV
ncbi:MAG: zinc-ribbon domain-containing protein [Thaumarchaeota archaeon]|nr:zinc-ribbon domain-containing protein [Nitrososphaerota archaeon]